MAAPEPRDSTLLSLGIINGSSVGLLGWLWLQVPVSHLPSFGLAPAQGISPACTSSGADGFGGCLWCPWVVQSTELM